MFRKMARANKAIPEAECLEILKNELRGVLCFELIPEHMTGKLVNES